MVKTLYKILVLSIVLLGCGERSPKESQVEKKGQLGIEIDTYLRHMMDTHKIPGMAVAVVGRDTLVHQGYYGVSSREAGDEVTDRSVFKIFSLTKTMVAVGVFKLIEEGKLKLSDVLSDFFTQLPDEWQGVTVANLLSHSSGLPDVMAYEEEFLDDSISTEEFIKLLFNEPMDFEVGTEWNYNQTNYLLLRRLIEKVTGMDFVDFLLAHQFTEVAPQRVFFHSNIEEKKEDLVNYYAYDAMQNDYVEKPEFSGNKNLPLAGICTTLDEYVAWSRRLDQGLLISDETKRAMWTPFDFKGSDRQFLHAWDVYKVNGHDSFGFSGGGVSGYRKFIAHDLSIIVLTTGYAYYSVQDIIIDHIAGMVERKLKDEASESVEAITATYFLAQDTLNIGRIVDQVKLKYPTRNLERTFKSLGYRLFFDLNKKEEAIRLFEENVRAYPESYDTHGSLAYLQYLTNSFEASKKNYSKALEMNPNNPYSVRMIERINTITKAE